LEGEKPLNFVLECLQHQGGGTKRSQFQIQGVVGLHLVGRSLNENTGVQLISYSMALDQDQFRRLWKHFSGNRKFHWENGTPAKMEGLI